MYEIETFTVDTQDHCQYRFLKIYIYFYSVCIFEHIQRHNVCCGSDQTFHSNMRHHVTLSIKALQHGLQYYLLCTMSFKYLGYLWLNYMVIIRCFMLIRHEFLKQICVLRPCCLKHNMHLWQCMRQKRIYSTDM